MQEEAHQELQQNKTQAVQEEVLRREQQRELLSRMFQTWHCQGWNSRQLANGGIGFARGTGLGRPVKLEQPLSPALVEVAKQSDKGVWFG